MHCPAACPLARCATHLAVTVNLGPGCSPSAGCWALGSLGPGGQAAAGKKAIGQAEHISTGSIIAEVLHPSTALIVSSNAMGITRGGSQAATCLLGVCLPRHLTMGGFSGLWLNAAQGSFMVQTHFQKCYVWVNSFNDCCSAASAKQNHTKILSLDLCFVSLSASITLRGVAVICHKQLRILAYVREYPTCHQKVFLWLVIR